MVWALQHRFWGCMLLLLSLQAPLEASPSGWAESCRSWILRSLSFFRTQSIEPQLFDKLKRRAVFVTSDETQGEREIPMHIWIQFSEVIETLKQSHWTQDQKKVLEFVLNDDTLTFGIDLSNQSTMVSGRLDRPLLVISADQLYDKETWIHESAHWWILNQYPEIAGLYKRVLEELRLDPSSEIATKLEGALRIWFEIKANDLSFSPAKSVMTTTRSYETLSIQLSRQLNIEIPKSKSQAKAFRKNLREEILNLIRWGYGLHLDEHHLQLFE